MTTPYGSFRRVVKSNKFIRKVVVVNDSQPSRLKIKRRTASARNFKITTIESLNSGQMKSEKQRWRRNVKSPKKKKGKRSLSQDLTKRRTEYPIFNFTKFSNKSPKHKKRNPKKNSNHKKGKGSQKLKDLQLISSATEVDFLSDDHTVSLTSSSLNKDTENLSFFSSDSEESSEFSIVYSPTIVKRSSKKSDLPFDSLPSTNSKFSKINNNNKNNNKNNKKKKASKVISCNSVVKPKTFSMDDPKNKKNNYQTNNRNYNNNHGQNKPKSRSSDFGEPSSKNNESPKSLSMSFGGSSPKRNKKKSDNSNIPNSPLKKTKIKNTFH